jgi:hypothetical protein
LPASGIRSRQRASASTAPLLAPITLVAAALAIGALIHVLASERMTRGANG